MELRIHEVTFVHRRAAQKEWKALAGAKPWVVEVKPLVAVRWDGTGAGLDPAVSRATVA
jgi:hypothetical protein